MWTCEAADVSGAVYQEADHVVDEVLSDQVWSRSSIKLMYSACVKATPSAHYHSATDVLSPPR